MVQLTLATPANWLLDLVLKHIFHPMLKGEPNMRETPDPGVPERKEQLWCVECEAYAPHLIIKWQPSGLETSECSECGLEMDW